MVGREPDQLGLFPSLRHAAGRGRELPPLRGQVLKWIGNKHRFAARIVSAFPRRFGRYIEPFLGSGAVLAELAPPKALATDVLPALVQIHEAVKRDPEALIRGYGERREAFLAGERGEFYRAVRDAYNADPNMHDLFFLLRTCYGGVIRFSRAGRMNTPCGSHRPLSVGQIEDRVAAWRPRVQGAEFGVQDFEASIDAAQADDLIYCDPPYSDSASTIYGAQAFSLPRLLAAIERARARGAHVALSIDGKKRSGRTVVELDLPEGLFAQEQMILVGRSMLRRFQLAGETLEDEIVHDRLLTTWREA